MGEWAVPQEGGTGGGAGLPLGDGIFTTNPAPPPSPGHTFNRVIMSRTYQVQVDFCGNSYCLDPKRQAQMQVQKQDPEEVRSEICQEKGWGQVLGHETGGGPSSDRYLRGKRYICSLCYSWEIQALTQKVFNKY